MKKEDKNFRFTEFGRNRGDDFSTSTTDSDKAFAFNDGTTTLVRNNMKKDSDFNIFMVLVFKILTFLQEATLKQANVEFYYKLTKLHFKLYFGKSLIGAAINNSREFQVAQHRHGCMVVSNTKIEGAPNIAQAKRNLYKYTTSAFQKNLLLEAEL